MRRLICLPVLLAAGLLAACGADEERAASPPAPADSTRLIVEVTHAQPDLVRMELRCGGARPCDAGRMSRLGAALDKAENRARACTMVYGGPERAHVTGTLEGRRVDVSMSRSDGCGIADYDALFAALGRKPPLAG
jgi:hypothetical protein